MRQHRVTLYTWLSFSILPFSHLLVFLCVHNIRRRESILKKKMKINKRWRLYVRLWTRFFLHPLSKNSSDLPLISFIGFNLKWGSNAWCCRWSSLYFFVSMEFKMVCFINDYLMTICVLLRPPDEIFILIPSE